MTINLYSSMENAINAFIDPQGMESASIDYGQLQDKYFEEIGIKIDLDKVAYGRK